MTIYNKLCIFWRDGCDATTSVIRDRLRVTLELPTDGEKFHAIKAAKMDITSKYQLSYAPQESQELYADRFSMFGPKFKFLSTEERTKW